VVHLAVLELDDHRLPTLVVYVNAHHDAGTAIRMQHASAYRYAAHLRCRKPVGYFRAL
jgi:hypothetical protein